MSSERADFAAELAQRGADAGLYVTRLVVQRTCIEATRTTSNTATARTPPPEHWRPWTALLRPGMGAAVAMLDA